ncbi:hypothetical protein CVT25_007234 [Psilocybe cyanescens]|uniref:F-box domain-containing protein n=1 Tax=Psilocybe cyanescens TaxID=93625 RepID=A0A409XVT4_PSICY|nr:hypothetical protein CVT25_007234 [Psilocybe cyanescens]
MLLSPENQLTQALPVLPVEIINDIIEEASGTLDVSSVSAIALTSHTFRIHANKARFSSLVPYRNHGHNIEHTSRGIRTLADIIECGHSAKPSMPGVCEFVTSFSLQMIGYYDEVMPALEDGRLAYIFNNLFWPSCLPPSSAARSLSLHIYRWSRNDDDYFFDDEDSPRYNGLSWRSIHPKLLIALEDLLRRSEITQLDLTEMRNIPRNFLQGSNVKHLRLGRSTISEIGSYYNYDNTAGGGPMLLESLDIDCLVSYKGIGLITHLDSDIPESPRNILPHLVNLSVQVRHPGNLEIMNQVLDRAPALQSLIVDIWMDSRDYISKQDSFSINYKHLAQLNSISFKIYEKKSSSAINLLLKYDAPPSLSNLSITIVHWARNPITYPATEHLESTDINVLDNHLARSSFYSVKHIDIVLVDISEENYKEYRTPSHLAPWCSYIKSQLPLSLEKNPGLDVCVRWKDCVVWKG